MRATALVCLGAGAGLIRSDLRLARGTDVIARSGGVIVAVGGRRPRTVPVLARYNDRLLDAAHFVGEHLLPAGARHRQLSVRTLLVGTRFRHRCSPWTGTLPCTSPSPTAGSSA